MTDRWNDVPLLWYILADGEIKTNLQCQVLTRCNESFVHLQYSTCNGFNSVLSMDDLNAKTRHLIEKLSIKMEMVMRIRMLIPH